MLMHSIILYQSIKGKIKFKTGVQQKSPTNIVISNDFIPVPMNNDDYNILALGSNVS